MKCNHKKYRLCEYCFSFEFRSVGTFPESGDINMEWQAIYENMEKPNFEKLINKPSEWQVSLADTLRFAVNNGSVLEAGCGFGVTSLLIGSGAQRTLLDLEPKAIETARNLFDWSGQSAEFAVGDLLNMSFPDNSFDVVFNAGVLEHFDKAGRCEALREMARVAKPGGTVCVAIPNHFSVPYRFAYEYRKAHGKWPYPDEEKIFDFSEELATINNLTALKRETVGEETIFYFLTKLQRIWFKFRHQFARYEGYLTILTLKKSIAAE
jgi:ubiquinone/menaquinone biosynthesis C-methylase UbiE